MGKVTQVTIQAPTDCETVHNSWSSELARQLHPAVRHRLIVDEKQNIIQLMYLRIQTNKLMDSFNITKNTNSAVCVVTGQKSFAQTCV